MATKLEWIKVNGESRDELIPTYQNVTKDNVGFDPVHCFKIAATTLYLNLSWPQNSKRICKNNQSSGSGSSGVNVVSPGTMKAVQDMGTLTLHLRV
jgi:hypothetical protein